MASHPAPANEESGFLSKLSASMKFSQDVVLPGQAQEGIAGMIGLTLSEVQSGKRNPTSKHLNNLQSQIKSSQAQISINQQINSPVGSHRQSNSRVMLNQIPNTKTFQKTSLRPQDSGLTSSGVGVLLPCYTTPKTASNANYSVGMQKPAQMIDLEKDGLQRQYLGYNPNIYMQQQFPVVQNHNPDTQTPGSALEMPIDLVSDDPNLGITEDGKQHSDQSTNLLADGLDLLPDDLARSLGINTNWDTQSQLTFVDNGDVELPIQQTSKKLCTSDASQNPMHGQIQQEQIRGKAEAEKGTQVQPQNAYGLIPQYQHSQYHPVPNQGGSAQQKEHYQFFHQPGCELIQQPANQTYYQLSNHIFQQPSNQIFQHPGNQMFQQPSNQMFQHLWNQTFQQPGYQMFPQFGNQMFQHLGNQTFQQPGYQMFQQPDNQMFQQPDNQMIQQPDNQMFQQAGNQMFQQPGHIYTPQQFCVQGQQYSSKRPFPYVACIPSQQQRPSEVLLQSSMASASQQEQSQIVQDTQLSQNLPLMPNYGLNPYLGEPETHTSVQMGFLGDQNVLNNTSASPGALAAPFTQREAHMGSPMMDNDTTGKSAVNEQKQRDAFKIILENGRDRATKQNGLLTPDLSPQSSALLGKSKRESKHCKTNETPEMVPNPLGLKAPQTKPGSRKRKLDNQSIDVLQRYPPRQALVTKQGIPQDISQCQHFQNAQICPNSGIQHSDSQRPSAKFLQGGVMDPFWLSQSATAQASLTPAPSTQTSGTQAPPTITRSTQAQVTYVQATQAQATQAQSTQAPALRVNQSYPSDITEPSHEGRREFNPIDPNIDPNLELWNLLSEEIMAPPMDRNDSGICLNSDEEPPVSCSLHSDDIRQDISINAPILGDDGKQPRSASPLHPTATMQEQDEPDNDIRMPDDPTNDPDEDSIWAPFFIDERYDLSK